MPRFLDVVMKPFDPYKLRFGPYEPPKVPRNGRLFCEMRGSLPVGNHSDGPIPWPMRRGKKSLILCGDLARAVKRESVEAVSYHWDVCRAVVQKWRKTLGVEEFNEGTRQLRASADHLGWQHRQARGLERRKNVGGRISPRLAKPRPLRRPAVSMFLKERMALTGRHPNPALRLWTPAEEKLLGTDTDAAIARMLRRTISAVVSRRNASGIPAFGHAYERVWTSAEDRLLGTQPDRELAKRFGYSARMILQRRLKLGVPYVNRAKRRWTAREDRLLGTKPDREIARLLNRSVQAVTLRRLHLGTPNRCGDLKPWTAGEMELLGAKPDRVVAQLTGRTERAVRLKRWKAGILRRPPRHAT